MTIGNHQDWRDTYNDLIYEAYWNLPGAFKKLDRFLNGYLTNRNISKYCTIETQGQDNYRSDILCAVAEMLEEQNDK